MRNMVAFCLSDALISALGYGSFCRSVLNNMLLSLRNKIEIMGSENQRHTRQVILC